MVQKENYYTSPLFYGNWHCPMEVRWTWKIFFYQNGLDNNENETIEKTLKLCLNFH